MHVCWNWGNFNRELGMGKLLKDGMNYKQVKQISVRVKGKELWYIYSLTGLDVVCTTVRLSQLQMSNELVDGWMMADWWFIFTSLLTAYWSYRDWDSRGTMSRNFKVGWNMSQMPARFEPPCCWSIAQCATIEIPRPPYADGRNA